MNAITTAVLNKSKVEVSLIRIENATKDSFVMSLMGRTTKIGLVTATISAMTVDLVGPKGIFGRLDLPAHRMGSFGGDLRVFKQPIRILDTVAFKAFVRSILKDEDLVLRLDHGQASVRALGMTAQVVYRKDLHLKGLTSLTSTLIQVKPFGSEYESTFCLYNPSPFEIDLGTVLFQVQDEHGKVIAEQKGSTFLMRGGACYSVVTGHIDGKISEGKARFIGLGAEGDSWVKDIIDLVDIKATIPSVFRVWHAS
ncbi:hypothetical protein LLEC1_07269 [Akanthomyces lecanii]|uniref:Uncharacterized protein n=1 Tax=Cordyceps confragosa TaxID=2714763 RepID=A0A179I7Y1_CORDF|nr:hypothetical protein LLEC1_07269 [Akanthomyces lecanii]